MEVQPSPYSRLLLGPSLQCGDLQGAGLLPPDPEEELRYPPTMGSLTLALPPGKVVLDTNLPGLVFSQQFIQLPVGPGEEGIYFTLQQRGTFDKKGVQTLLG